MTNTPTNGNGWVLLHRKLLNTSFYKDSRAVHLAVHLLLSATHKATRVDFGFLVTLLRGQYLGGYKRLGNELNWTKMQVRRAINLLEKESFLSRYITNKYCIITILNYNGYQGLQKYAGLECYESTPQPLLSATTVPSKAVLSAIMYPHTTSINKVHPSDAGSFSYIKQITPVVNANAKAELKAKADADVIASAKEAKLLKVFEHVWEQYPKKLGKKDAFRHFKHSVTSEKKFKDILTALINYKNSKNVANGFVQNGSTWFHNWEDWISDPEETTDESITRKMKESLDESKHRY